MTLPVGQVKDAHQVWIAHHTRRNTRKQSEKDELKKKQAPEVIIDADLEDINKLFEEKGTGPHMLELDFEPAAEAPVTYVSDRTRKSTTHWAWRHKYTKVVVKRYPTTSGKAWDTGALSDYLRKRITEKQHRVGYQRAKQIIKLNTKGAEKVKPGSNDVPLA